MANTWTNSDGLFIKFGATEGTVGGITGIGWAAEYSRLADGRHMVEVVLNPMTAIPSSAASGAGIVSDTVTIPSGARMDEIQVFCDTVATGTGATLNLGLVDQDRSTEIDYDGFLAALALTSIDAAGERTTVTAGSTSAGALLGTTLTNTGLISVDYDTAAYTAGKIRIYILYKMSPLV